MNNAIASAICAITVIASSYTSFGQEVIITNLASGEIGWSGPDVGYYNVLWASKPDGPWQARWSALADIPAYTNTTAKVPMYYKVTWTPYPRDKTIKGETLGVTQAGETSYFGHFDNTVVIAHSVNIVLGNIVLWDNGVGSLLSPTDAQGVMNYDTGFWFVDLSGESVPTNANISGTYEYCPFWAPGTEPAAVNISGEIVGSTAEGVSTYSGTLDNKPVKEGSLSINAGPFVWTDNGDGTLSGTAGTTGTINYETGAWSIDLQALIIVEGTLITGAYTYSSGGTAGQCDW